MKIQQIRRDKDEYMDLLLMADPQRDMIESYLDRSEVFVLVNGGDVCGICVVEPLKNRKCEYAPSHLRALWQSMRYHVCGDVQQQEEHRVF